jgi:hypothetical protein
MNLTHSMIIGHSYHQRELRAKNKSLYEGFQEAL